MARVLIVGGGCRGRQLARAAIADGHAVRITTRGEGGRAAVEQAGAECWVGTPLRLATLRGALEGVTIACWLLGTASGAAQELAELHGNRLEFFMTQAIDTTVRGILYEARGSLPRELLGTGERLARALAARNAIPFAALDADPAAGQAWLEQARGAVNELLGV